MVSTRQSIYKILSRNKLLYRYLNDDDGVSGDEGSFAVCNFWLAKNFAKAGDVKTAVDIFETMLKYSSPSGLFSEEIDMDTGELIGNYPQGFTHIGLISAALCINEAYQKGAI
jgi:GH15 family glucan-1,4-alpha-glucosidase